MFAVQADGADVVTVEGLAPADGQLSDVQQAMHACHGLQCGFCTPGFIVSITALLERDPDPDDDGDPRRPVRQPLPLHRLPGDHRGRPHGRRGRGAPA